MESSRILLVIVVLAGGFAAASAQAVTVPFTTFVADGGPLDGATGSGTLVYDDTLLTGSGDESIGVTGGAVATIADPSLALTLTMFGQTFTAGDDVSAPDFPVLGFSAGDLVYVDFAVAEAGVVAPVNPTDILLPGLLSFTMFDVLPTPGGLTIEVFPFTIPEPGSTGLAGLALLALAWCRDAAARRAAGGRVPVRARKPPRTARASPPTSGGRRARRRRPRRGRRGWPPGW